MIRKSAILLLFLCISGLTKAATAATAAPVPASAAGLPKFFAAVYAIKRNDLEIGITQLALAPLDNNTYAYEATTRASGALATVISDEIRERSRWTFADSFLRPLEYTYKRSGGKVFKYININFDWSKKIAATTVGKQPWKVDLPPNALDKNLYQLSLMHDLKLGKRHLEYQVADDGKLKNYQFTILGEENITTELGPMRALKLQRNNDERGSTFWCASKLNYLPVLLQQTESDGTRYSMHIRFASGLN